MSEARPELARELTIDLGTILNGLDERLAGLPDDIARAHALGSAHQRLAEMEEQLHMARARIARELAAYPSITMGDIRAAILRRRRMSEHDDDLFPRAAYLTAMRRGGARRAARH